MNEWMYTRHGAKLLPMKRNETIPALKAWEERDLAVQTSNSNPKGRWNGVAGKASSV